ncbi:MAG: TetR/AcrR family transcriptional regulator [Gammaproteobacteria bacterium]|nr:MAG: TetR/AcrR family transcriptional regulator [Gammaproteobacteria bacterium]
MSKQPGRRGKDNRQRIVEAANELFYHKGYGRTSFSDIAEAANFPRGNFYYYFKTKNQLLEEVLQHRLQGLKAMVNEWTQTYEDPARRLACLADMIEYSADEIVAWGCPIGTLISELGKADERLQARARQLFDVIIDWLREQLEALGHGEQSDVLAKLLISRVQGITTLAHAYHDRTYLDYEVRCLREEIQRIASREHPYECGK